MILIIDGNNLAHRCRHVFSLSHKGEDVSVLYGFLSVLTSYMRKFQPESVVVAWDGGIPKYRLDLLPSYKANRQGLDPIEYQIFKNQLDKLRVILPSFGVLSVVNYGSEADDIMSQATQIISSERFVIVSNDRDMVQCINNKVSVYIPATGNKGTLVGSNNLNDLIPVGSEVYLDWRAIQGDNSDNISGVRMVGEVTATKLFKEYGNLAAIVNAAEKGVIGGKLAQNILEFGADRLWDNIRVMSLQQDITGARKAILDTQERWTPFSLPIVKKFLFGYAFASLMDSGTYGLYNRLKNISPMHVRFPLCKERRMYID